MTRAPTGAIEGTAGEMTTAERDEALPPSLLRRFGTGVIWNLLAVAFNQGSTFAANIALANILGRAVFGRYAIVMSTVQSVSALAALGMGFAATKYIAELRVHDRARARRILAFCSTAAYASAAIVSAAIWLAAPVLTARYLHAPDLGHLLRVGALGILWLAVNGYLTGVLAGLEEYKTAGVASTISGTAYLALCVGGAWKWGLEGAVMGVVASAGVQWIVLTMSLRRALQRHDLVADYRRLSQERAIIMRWVVPGLLSGLTAVPALWLVQSFLVRSQGGFNELGAYTASYSLMAIVLFLPGVANNVGMSIINHSFGSGNGHGYREVFWLNLRFSVGIVFLGAVGIAALGPLLLRAFGTSFASAYPVLLILLAATLPEAATIALSQVLQSNERFWLAIAAINVPRDATIIIVAWLLAPTLGARGLALAYLSGRVLGLLTTAYCAHRVGLNVPARLLEGGVAVQPS